MTLTARRQKFVDAYVGVANLNGTKAARMAGYAEKSASVEAHRLLRNASIQEAISKLLKRSGTLEPVAVERMARWSEGTVEPFLTESGDLDLATDYARENLHLVKKVKRTVTTTSGEDWETIREVTELELHDPKDANKEILKLTGAYAQPEAGEVKFLIVGPLEDVVPDDGK